MREDGEMSRVDRGTDRELIDTSITARLAAGRRYGPSFASAAKRTKLQRPVLRDDFFLPSMIVAFFGETYEQPKTSEEPTSQPWCQVQK